MRISDWSSDVCSSDLPVLVTGSPGGAHIINYVTKSIVAVLDWGLDPEHAVALPNISNRNGPTVLEAGLETGIAPDLAGGLRRLGHETRAGTFSSGINLLLFLADGSLVWPADPPPAGPATNSQETSVGHERVCTCS